MNGRGPTTEPASLIGCRYAFGPADWPFSADDSAWNVHTIVRDDPSEEIVTVEDASGRRFTLARPFAREMALAPSAMKTMSLR